MVFSHRDDLRLNSTLKKTPYTLLPSTNKSTPFFGKIKIHKVEEESVVM